MLDRRSFLKLSALALAAGAAPFGLRRTPYASAAPSTADASRRPRYLIVNADDFGMTAGINRGVFEAHAHGVLTSASLLVEAPATEEAVSGLDEYPKLSVGLHVDLTSGHVASIPWTDLAALSREVERQLTVFTRLSGGTLPTHIDSHHHIHHRFNVARAFLEVSERYRLPLRGLSPVVYLGGFYGRWPDDKTDMKRISPEALIALITSIGPGVSEIGCHPGYFESNVGDGYGREREVELHALLDPRVRGVVEREHIRLTSYLDSALINSAFAHAGSG